MTWPLALGVTRDVPGDLGDPLLNMWIVGWNAENLPKVLTGQIGWHELWNANIFHPEPLALAFSEHLTGQVLQILPIYYLTGNLILSYNLLFLSSFVLSGLGMYLLVRDLLGEEHRFSWAAFIAGLIFAFVPLRIDQVAHIQSLSSQWMPFALFGFRRFILRRTSPSVARLPDVASDTSQWMSTIKTIRPLAGGSAALLMQNWSCGYYLIFFTPFVVLFVLHQILTAGRARDPRVWIGLLVAGAVVAAGTWPFLSLYLEAQRVHAFARPLGEVIRFSADVLSYFTAPDALRIWGGVMAAYPKPEGALFFGVVPNLLFLVALTQLGRLRSRRRMPPRHGWRSVATTILVAVIVIQVAGFIGVLFTGGFITNVAGIPVRATNPSRILVGVGTAVALLLAVSGDARYRAAAICRSPLALAVSLTVLAVWLSLGPVAQSRGRVLPGLGLYGVLYDHVPGFNGLRVPARYAMVAAVFLCVVAGYGAAALIRRRSKPTLVAIPISIVFLLEAAFAPMLLNQTWGDGGVIPPPTIVPSARAPDVYRRLAELNDAHVIAEFPFGDPAWELRYVYYSTAHWKRLVNGYSGGFPQGYKVRVAYLQRLVEDPGAAWNSLIGAGTTHVVVHEAAYSGSGAQEVDLWLRAHGAQLLDRYGTDVLYAMPR
jgi:hypothetical protein